MPKRKKAWVTGNAPTSETEACRRFSVPNDIELVGAVTGALLPLTVPENWEQGGSMTPEEAALIMSLAFEAFVNSDCTSGECQTPSGNRIVRLSPTGKFQRADGDTWVDSPDEETPPPAARPEATAPEQQCGAASNAAHVLKLLYLETLESWNDTLDEAASKTAFALQVGALLGSGFGPWVTAALEFADIFFYAFYAAFEVLTEIDWSDEFTSELVCILQSNSTNADGAVTFDYLGVQRDLVGLVFPIVDEFLRVRWQVWYMLQFIGADGLNAAGAVQAVEGDCATCGQWCYVSSDWSEWERLGGGQILGDGKIGITTGNPSYQYGGYGGNSSNYAEYQLVVDTSNCVITGYEWELSSDASNYAAVHTRMAYPTEPDASLTHTWPANYALPQFAGWSEGTIESTSAETTLYMAFPDSPGGSARGVRWRVYGTGVNPFSIGSNC